MGDPDFERDPFFREVEFCLLRTHPSCIIVSGSRNQGRTDSCYAFVVVNCIYADLYINQGEGVRASEQLFLDCLHLIYPPDKLVERESRSGYANSYKNALRYTQERGLLLNKDYPWKSKREDCTRGKRLIDSKIIIKDYVALNSIAEVIQRLDMNYAVLSGVYCTDKFRIWTGTKIYTLSDEEKREIEEEKRKKQSKGYHALTVIGYSEEEGTEYFLALNSVGQEWGYNGFVKVERGCMVKFYYVYGSEVKTEFMKKRR